MKSKYVFMAGIFMTYLLGSGAHSQTIQPDAYGMEFRYPTLSSWPKFHIAHSRIEAARCSHLTTPQPDGNRIPYWANIELTPPDPVTGQKRYTWDCLDEIVNGLAPHVGSEITYTFAVPPPFYNGGDRKSPSPAPPKNFKDYFDFAQALVSRYKGKIRYYEAWNEYGNSRSSWSGTVPQMVELVKGLSAIVHKTDPKAVVVCPSLGGYPVTLDDQLWPLASKYCDVMNTHSYYVMYSKDPNPFAPEQLFVQMKQYDQMRQAYAVSGKPFFVNEGALLNYNRVPGLNDPRHSDPVPAQVAYVGIWQLALANEGVSRWSWFYFDGDGGPAGSNPADVPPLYLDKTCGSSALCLNPRGVAYREMQSWLTGATITTHFSRIAKSNRVHNPTGNGATPGSPGVGPANWAYFPANGSGLQSTIVGRCSGGGHNGFAVRLSGTYLGIGRNTIELNFASGHSDIPISAADTYMSASAFVTRTAGSNSGVSYAMTLWEEDSAKHQSNIALDRFVPEAIPLENGYQWYGGPTFSVDRTAVAVNAKISIAATRGVPVDTTLCIADANIDSGTTWSGQITRPGGYQAQIAWDMDGMSNPAGYVVPGPYTYYQKLDATNGAIAGRKVTLTDQPILLGNRPLPAAH